MTYICVILISKYYSLACEDQKKRLKLFRHVLVDIRFSWTHWAYRWMFLWGFDPSFTTKLIPIGIHCHEQNSSSPQLYFPLKTKLHLLLKYTVWEYTLLWILKIHFGWSITLIQASIIHSVRFIHIPFCISHTHILREVDEGF